MLCRPMYVNPVCLDRRAGIRNRAGKPDSSDPPKVQQVTKVHRFLFGDRVGNEPVPASSFIKILFEPSDLCERSH